MNKKIIAICSSASHYKQALEIEKKLKQMGFKVYVPEVANMMRKSNNFEVSFYKTWFKNKDDYKKKTKYLKGHFKKVINADLILVTNFEKKGTKGYIGGNVLMEMAIAFHHKKPIYVLNNISDMLPVMEEVYSLQPIFINGDLKKIKIK